MEDEDIDQPYEFTPDPRSAAPERDFVDELAAMAAQHVGGRLPCLCATCPAGFWRILAGRSGVSTDEHGELARADDTDPWRVAVFCKALRQDLAKFTPDYREKRLKAEAGDQVVTHCAAYAEELAAWRGEQK